MPKLRELAKKLGMWVGLGAGIGTLVSIAAGLFVLSSDVTDLKLEVTVMRLQVDKCRANYQKVDSQLLITQERYNNVKLYAEMNCRER